MPGANEVMRSFAFVGEWLKVYQDLKSGHFKNLRFLQRIYLVVFKSRTAAPYDFYRGDYIEMLS